MSLKHLVFLLCASHAIASPWNRHEQRGVPHGPPAYGEDDGSSSTPRPTHWSGTTITHPTLPSSPYVSSARTSRPAGPPPNYGPVSSSTCETWTLTLPAGPVSTVTKYSTKTLPGQPSTHTETQTAPGTTVTSKIYSTVTKYQTTGQNASTIYQHTTIYSSTTAWENSYLTKTSTTTCTKSITTSLPGATVTEKSVQPASTITQWRTVSGPTRIVTVEETEFEYSTVYNTHTLTETKVVTAPGKCGNLDGDVSA